MIGDIPFVFIYLAVTMVFFGVTAIVAGREMKARRDFKMALLGGTYNVYRYYKHLRMNNEGFSTMFKLFLLAHLNFAVCAIVSVAYAVWLVD
jgi:hypothetical protein